MNVRWHTFSSHSISKELNSSCCRRFNLISKVGVFLIIEKISERIHYSGFFYFIWRHFEPIQVVFEKYDPFCIHPLFQVFLLWEIKIMMLVTLLLVVSIRFLSLCFIFYPYGVDCQLLLPIAINFGQAALSLLQRYEFWSFLLLLLLFYFLFFFSFFLAIIYLEIMYYTALNFHSNWLYFISIFAITTFAIVL